MAGSGGLASVRASPHEGWEGSVASGESGLNRLNSRTSRTLGRLRAASKREGFERRSCFPGSGFCFGVACLCAGRYNRFAAFWERTCNCSVGSGEQAGWYRHRNMDFRAPGRGATLMKQACRNWQGRGCCGTIRRSWHCAEVCTSDQW